MPNPLNYFLHYPSTCSMSHWSTVNGAFAKGISGDTSEPEPFKCKCRCSDCRTGQCTPFGTRAQTESFARVREERLRRQTVFDATDAKEIGRSLDGFRYRIEFLHAGDEVDTYYTDLVEERDRLLESAEDQGYGIRIEYGPDWVESGESDE